MKNTVALSALLYERMITTLLQKPACLRFITTWVSIHQKHSVAQFVFLSVTMYKDVLTRMNCQRHIVAHYRFIFQ